MRFIRGDTLKVAVAAFHADESLKKDTAPLPEERGGRGVESRRGRAAIPWYNETLVGDRARRWGISSRRRGKTTEACKEFDVAVRSEVSGVTQDSPRSARGR